MVVADASVALIGTLVQLGLYPLVIWLMLEIRDLTQRQKVLAQTNTVVIKTLLKKKVIDIEEISGVNLDG